MATGDGGFSDVQSGAGQGLAGVGCARSGRGRTATAPRQPPTSRPWVAVLEQATIVVASPFWGVCLQELLTRMSSPSVCKNHATTGQSPPG